MQEGDEVDQILGQILQQAVWERLDMLDELASQADDAAFEPVARAELPRLTDGWRALLASHEPDSKGRCPECSRRWRPRRGPCAVWQAARTHFLGEAGPSDGPADPHTATMQLAMTH